MPDINRTSKTKLSRLELESLVGAYGSACVALAHGEKDRFVEAANVLGKALDSLYESNAPETSTRCICVWNETGDSIVEQKADCPMVLEAQRSRHVTETPAATVADYEEVLAGHRRLVRELDVLLNGDGAAPQASLCDIVSQVRSEKRAASPREPAPSEKELRAAEARTYGGVEPRCRAQPVREVACTQTAGHSGDHYDYLTRVSWPKTDSEQLREAGFQRTRRKLPDDD